MLPLPRALTLSSALRSTSRPALLRLFSSYSTEKYLSTHVISSVSRSLPSSSLLFKTSHTPNAFRIIQPHQARGYADKKEVIVKVPTMMDSVTEGSLKQWSKNIGDFVKQDEEVVAIETDKVDISVNAPVSGILKEFYAKEDDTVNVGADLFKMEAGEAGDAANAPTEKKVEKKAETMEASVPRKEDTTPPKKEEAKPKPVDNAPKPAEVTKPSPSTGPFDHRSEHRVKMPRIRTTIANRLKESQNTAASLTTFNEVDMTNLMNLRSTYKDLVLKEHGVKLGFMSAFTKAVCHAVKAVPSVNAMIEGPNGGDTIVYRDYVDVSVAVATPKGLVTPVIRNAERMTMVEIEKEIAALGVKARENKITLEDLAGGTFTISNGGVFGSLMGTPIINMPQSAILGMHAVKDRPIAINGEVKIRPMMYLALTYDHRLIDGREAVTFLVKIKEAIEDPRRLLLDV